MRAHMRHIPVGVKPVQHKFMSFRFRAELFMPHQLPLLLLSALMNLSDSLQFSNVRQIIVLINLKGFHVLHPAPWKITCTATCNPI
jgi:hypothetical protein